MNDLIVAIKLTLAYARQRPTRLLLTAFSAAAAAAIVVAVVSSYDSLLAKFAEVSGGFLGRYDVVVLQVNPNRADPQGPPPPPLSKSLVEALRADPGVAAVDPVFQKRTAIRKVGGEAPRGEPGEDGFPRAPTLVGTNAAEPPYALVAGRWIDPNTPGRLEAAISRGAAEQLGVQVGSAVFVARNHTLAIVGIVEQRKDAPQAGAIVGLPSAKAPPLTRGPAAAALYVPTALAEQITGAPAQIDFIGIALKPGAGAEEFRARWAEPFNSATPQAEAQSMTEVDAELADSSTADSVRGQAYSSTGVSLLAALFIILTTLSMGVDERVRQFAVLRAVALTKTQVAAMILAESLLLGLIGWGVGLLAGWGVMRAAASYRPDLFPVGASLGWYCVVLSGACALGGALLAAIVPAWRATRVGPLDAMAPVERRPIAKLSILATLLGLALVAVNPIVVFLVPMPDTSRYLASAAIGCTCMAVGFALLAPAVVIVTEKLLGPLVARLLGLDPAFLAAQLTGNLWRTLGTVMALTVGLGLFVAMQVWGYSMLAPFTPGEWVPDLLVSVQPPGVPLDKVDAVKAIPGVKPGRCLPIIAEQVKFATDVTGAKERNSASRQNNCVMVGVDPDLGLGGADPLFHFDFVEGNREEAVSKIKSGRGCLVPDHFARESGLGLGGTFGVLSPGSTDKILEYEIAGIVRMNGWHWMSKIGMRNRGGGRSAGLMFADFTRVRNDFGGGSSPVKHFWMDIDGSASNDAIKESFNKMLGIATLPKTSGRGAAVTVRSVADVRRETRQRADGIIGLLSQMPLVTLAVTSLGVANLVLSSVRARRWELGVLRALGVTRWGLVRIVLAEAILVAGAACLLSLGLGLAAGYCGTGVSRYVSVRGGLSVPLVVPWPRIGVGFGITFGLCLLAALWPALRAGFTEPLKLLQAGRGAA